MKFNQYLRLRRRAVDELVARAEGNERATHEPDVRSYAYLGDAVYSLYVRRKLVETGIVSTRVLHDLAAQIVSAKAQSRVLLQMEAELTAEEREFCRRARNAFVHTPASATVGEYHRSTAWEALLGYYAWRERHDRIDTLLASAWRIVTGELADEIIA